MTRVFKVIVAVTVVTFGETEDGFAGTRAVQGITGSRVRQRRYFWSP